MPVSEPHVPAPATKWVMRPDVWRHSSGPGGLLVGRRVVRVGVLVGAERVELGGQPLGDLVVALRVVGWDGDRADDDLGAVRPQQRHLLGRRLVGHHEHALVAALGGDDRQTDTGVAARRLDDRATRFQ